MMDEFKWMKKSLILILLLQFPGAAARLSLAVRVGDEVTLPCGNVTAGQDKCNHTTWLLRESSETPDVALVSGGQIEAEPDRLSVTETCSLVIKEVRGEDFGRYICKQGQEQGPDSEVELSVVHLYEDEDGGEVVLHCDVWPPGQLTPSVKWLLQGQEVTISTQNMRITRSYCCYASVTFQTSNRFYTSRYTSLACEVTDGDSVQVLTFSSEASEPTTTSTAATTTEENTEAGRWRHIVVSVGLATLIVTVVAVNLWARTYMKKTQRAEIKVRYRYDEDDDDNDGTVNYENMRSSDRV